MIDDPPEDDLGNTNDLPDALLIDADREDQLDPLEYLIRQENAMTTKDKLKPPRPGKPAVAPAATPAAELPPLTALGMAQDSEPHETPPAPPAKPIVYSGVELRQHVRPFDASGTAWDDAIREVNIANALATRLYIDNAGDAARDALDYANPDPDIDTPATPAMKMIFVNPFEYIDKLEPIAPFNAYLARNAICTSLGYSVIAQLLAELRLANRPNVPDAEIDVFSKYQDVYDEQAKANRVEELGYTALPLFRAIPLAGAYMKLLYEQRATLDFSTKWPPTLPHEILHQMHTGERGQMLMDAYSAIEVQVIGADNPALGRIMEEKARIKAQRSEAEKLVHKAETTYVLEALRDARPEPLTDALWYGIPLYTQYRYSVMAHKQICRAAGDELNNTDRGKRVALDYDRLHKLADMAGQLTREIDAAFATAEIKAAFEQKRLDSRHDIRVRPPSPPAKPAMHRAPPPDPADTSMPYDDLGDTE